MSTDRYDTGSYSETRYTKTKTYKKRNTYT